MSDDSDNSWPGAGLDVILNAVIETVDLTVTAHLWLPAPPENRLLPMPLEYA